MIGKEAPPPAFSRSPSPAKAGEDFASAVVRLAGLSALLLGWRPGEFWGATPAELGAVLTVMAPEGEAAAGAEELARLRAMFPDEGEAPPPPFGWSPSPANAGED